MHSKALVMLLLAAVVYLSEAQMHQSEQCLCGTVHDRLIRKSATKDVQIYQATNFCSKVEIVVTLNDGYRYCLNSENSAVQKVISAILKKKGASSRAPPTQFTSN